MLGITEKIGVSVYETKTRVVEESLNKFLVPLSQCEFMLNSILDDLQPDA